MHSQMIHNPAIRYFHKILAHTLFGKEENNTIVSRDELFILLCVDQGRQVNIVTFMMERFVHLAKNNRTPIIIGGLVTMIADAIGPLRPLYELVPFGNIRPMDIEFCFNRIIIGNIGTDTFDYLISNEVVRLFTLPNHEKMSVHNRNNWLYDLDEHPIDPPSPPATPPKYECVNDPILKDEFDPETPPNYYNIAEPVPPSCADNHAMLIIRLNTFQADITIVKEEIKHISFDVIGLMDIAVEQFHYLNEVVAALGKKRG